MEHKREKDEQFIKMTTQPIGKLIVKLAIPTIISMLITAIYNMADTFFVSQLGDSATGAVGVVFSLMALIQAVGFMLGLGSGTLVSRFLGQQKNDEANKIASTGFFTALLFGIVLMVAGLLFLEELLLLLGATETILPYAIDYVQYILFGAPIMATSFVLNNLLRSEGKASLAMIGITTGGILNMILDPIFIFDYNMGISGAAIATLISQCISFIILLSFFLFKKSIVQLSLKNVALKTKYYGMIIKTGLPSFFRQGLASLATVALNVAAARYGDTAVAAMAVVSRIAMLIASVMIGFGQGYMPVIGYNYGAKMYGRVKKSCYFALKSGFIIMLSLAVLGFIFSDSIIQLFTETGSEVLPIGRLALRFQCIALPLHAVIVICNMSLQSVGKSLEATITSSSRQGIIFFPLIFILPMSIGLLGVQLVQPLADGLTFFISLIFLIRFLKHLQQLEKDVAISE